MPYVAAQAKAAHAAEAEAERDPIESVSSLLFVSARGVVCALCAHAHIARTDASNPRVRRALATLCVLPAHTCTDPRVHKDLL